jgi:peptide chain release factor 3
VGVVGQLQLDVLRSQDRDGNPVYMARNNWDLNRIKDDFPKLSFTATRERS